MTRKMIAPVLGSAFLLMGLSMPSCPGQQAMQQQIDGLKASETDMKNRLTAAEGTIKTLKDDLDQSKALLAQLSKTVGDQSATFEQIEASIKAMQSKAKPAAKRK